VTKWLGLDADIRCKGGLVIGPGSVIGESTYTVEHDVPIADLTPELIALLPAVEAPAPKQPDTLLPPTDNAYVMGRVLDHLETREPAIQGQGGDNHTIRVTLECRDLSASEDLTFEAMSRGWNARCSPPWELGELRKKIRSAYKSAKGAAGSALPQAAFEPIETPRPKGLYFVNYNDVKPVLNRRYIVKSLLMAGGMSVLYGDSWVGKTFVAVDLCFFISAGLDWRGLKVRKGLVVYVACEGGELINNRIVALRERYPGVEAALALVPCSVDLLHPNGDVQALIDLVKQAEDAHGDKAVLIVVDTTSRALAGGNENSPDDMGAFVRNVDKIRAATGAHTMLLHHVGKDATKGARGHSLLRAATDTEIEVADRQITVTKQRDGKALPTFRFELVTTILGVDDEGEFVDTCTVDYPAPGTAPSPASLAAVEQSLPDEDARLLGILRSFDNPNSAPDRVGVSLETITDAAIRADWTKAKGPGAKDVVRRGLNRLKAAGLATSAGARGKARWKAASMPCSPAKETAA
jgi:hypothetical protein